MPALTARERRQRLDQDRPGLPGAVQQPRLQADDQGLSGLAVSRTRAIQAAASRTQERSEEATRECPAKGTGHDDRRRQARELPRLYFRLAAQFGARRAAGHGRLLRAASRRQLLEA